tara:strand:- start:3460 stop:3798 length:339 start_codon:yes stop_codon:yes gene_type:complete
MYSNIWAGVSVPKITAYILVPSAMKNNKIQPKEKRRMREKKPRVDLDKVGHKDRERIDLVMQTQNDKKKKLEYLKMCINTYNAMSNRLIAARERDHYMMISKYCEDLMKGIK